MPAVREFTITRKTPAILGVSTIRALLGDMCGMRQNTPQCHSAVHR